MSRMAVITNNDKQLPIAKSKHAETCFECSTDFFSFEWRSLWLSSPQPSEVCYSIWQFFKFLLRFFRFSVSDFCTMVEPQPRMIGNKLCIGGFLYYYSKKAKTHKYWDCEVMRRGHCEARAVTEETQAGLRIIKGPTRSPHTHPPDREAARAEEVRQRLRSQAVEQPAAPPAQLLRDHLPQVEPEVLARLPERENLKRVIRRARRAKLPANPKSLDDLESLDAQYQKTEAGDQFLLFDSKNVSDFGAGRVLVFATRKNVERLANCRCWFVDGTFKVSPTIFTQVFTVLGAIEQEGRTADQAVLALPFIFALLSGKEDKMYTAVLQAVKRAATSFGIVNCTPLRVMSDFEVAIQNSVRHVFPSVTPAGCFFHLAKSVYRHVQEEEGLTMAYQAEDSAIRKQVHMMLALAFVPPSEVVAAYLELFDHVDDTLLNLMDYFDLNYVRGRLPRGRRQAQPPRFPVEVWNQYHATLAGQHCTNNVSEGWNHRFNVLAGKHHVDLYSFITLLQKEEKDVETMMVEVTMGRAVRPAKRRKYVSLEQRIVSIVQEYEIYVEEGRVLDYLRTLGYHVTIS